MQDYRSLRVWQESRDLALEIYQLTSVFPTDERFGLTAQMRRAAVSVSSNVAEGCSRSGRRDLARFLEMALGSAIELEVQLEPGGCSWHDAGRTFRNRSMQQAETLHHPPHQKRPCCAGNTLNAERRTVNPER